MKWINYVIRFDKFNPHRFYDGGFVLMSVKPHRLYSASNWWSQNPIQLPLPHSLTPSLSHSLHTAPFFKNW